ncbi:hypothetical protein CVT24_002751, partial [Panaeolus cyanescens]
KDISGPRYFIGPPVIAFTDDFYKQSEIYQAGTIIHEATHAVFDSSDYFLRHPPYTPQLEEHDPNGQENLIGYEDGDFPELIKIGGEVTRLNADSYAVAAIVAYRANMDACANVPQTTIMSRIQCAAFDTPRSSSASLRSSVYSVCPPVSAVQHSQGQIPQTNTGHPTAPQGQPTVQVSSYLDWGKPSTSNFCWAAATGAPPPARGGIGPSHPLSGGQQQAPASYSYPQTGPATNARPPPSHPPPGSQRQQTQQQPQQRPQQQQPPSSSRPHTGTGEPPAWTRWEYKHIPDYPPR